MNEAANSRRCFWPRCDADVEPERLGCREHWYRLPRDLRDRIWAAYQPGQTIDTITPAYSQALRECIAFARRIEPGLPFEEVEG